MKALSVQQPWAHLICCGLKDVENRGWQPAEVPVRILIHATTAKVPAHWEDQPSDVVSNVRNARQMRQIPEYADMAYGAIIGYVECYQVIRDSDSIWAAAGSRHWCLRDAHLFDKPIFGIKGVRGHLFDVPENDENNLPPSHVADLSFPERKGNTVILPASDAIIDLVESGADVVEYDFTDTMLDLFFEAETGEPLSISKVRFIGKDRTIEKELEEVVTGQYLDKDNHPYKVIEFPEEDLYWSYCALFIR